jgi:hypothetical protein
LEIQKNYNSQKRLSKKNNTEGMTISDFKLLQSYSKTNNIVQTQKQT